MGIRNFSDISKFPEIASLKLFSNLQGNIYIYIYMYISIVLLAVKEKFGKTSKSLKII